MKPVSGLTLVELLIAISVASITLSVAIPSFSTLIMNSERTANIAALQTAVSLARSEAVKRGYRVSLCRSDNPDAATPCASGSNWADGWILYTDRDGNGQPETSAEILLAHPAINDAADASLIGSGTLADRLEYLANGHLSVAVGPNDKIIRCDKRGYQSARAIHISSSGRVGLRSHDSATDPVQSGDCAQDGG
ncbi:MAG: GspH/FimT family pseudopilin [Nevskiales bacterium]